MPGLSYGTLVNIEGSDMSLRIALGKHQGNDSRTTTDIEHTVSTTRPSTQQHTVGSDLHGA